ncbi:type IV conjugative transfer system lipoprotein TraV [Cedecea sp. NFIX57]|uniref:type IV conjugative transfer system lipoprotein TraV n=1 Tax=Cedecea sp. NFIX57 TaxID=1566286 RepID=UPI000A0AD598|nr:type IV conjugative transfer system lipoprotein TraV [Cedecea sp. NFIX57]SMG59752.1 conjugal transfer pilus assembly protein TraV [Cedecea sp. NFIX57]
MTRLMIPLLAGVCLLTGCAGVKSEFECNATSSDSCMTMQQANEKAKAVETPARGKPAATALPRLAEGDFRTPAVTAPSVVPVPPLASLNTGHVTAHTAVVRPALPAPVPAPLFRPEMRSHTATRPVMPGDYPRPLRTGEQVASLWIAPYVDAGDVYHQPAAVLFVVKPSRWGVPQL